MRMLLGRASRILAAGLFTIFVCSSHALAYNCKSDRRVDVPMDFAIRSESAFRIHLSAYGGSDKSGLVMPAVSGAWRVYDAAGKQLDYFSQAMVIGASSNMMRDTNLEGLVAVASYTIELTTQEACANKRSVKRSVLMPAAVSEANIPAVSTPTLVQTGGWGFSSMSLSFQVTDDSGIQDIEVFINGTKT